MLQEGILRAEVIIGSICILILLLITGLRWLVKRAERRSNYVHELETRILEECERRATAEEKCRRLNELDVELKEREQRIAGLQSDNALIAQRVVQCETQLVEERKSAQERLELLKVEQIKLADAFKVLSADALKHNNQSFLELAKATLEKYQEGAKGDLSHRQVAIDNLVKPIKESLDKVDQKINELEKARAAAYGGLSEQVQGLAKTQSQLQSETANLVKALRQPTVRGRWGETQLRRVVELAGMVEQCDFTCQTSMSTDEGIRRPDLIVKLPNDHHIVVDAKTPLQAYLDALEAPDEPTRNARLIDHAKQVRNHISQLAAKSYWDQFHPTPEFVILFIPGEIFFSAALEQDPMLIEYGAEQRVMVATPTTLIALLRAVASGWRQEAITKNMLKISELGKQLYDRLRTLADHFEDLRRGLERAVESYNKAVGSMETRVLVSARKFRDLGTTTQGNILELSPIDSRPRALEVPVEEEELSEALLQ